MLLQRAAWAGVAAFAASGLVYSRHSTIRPAASRMTEIYRCRNRVPSRSRGDRALVLQHDGGTVRRGVAGGKVDIGKPDHAAERVQESSNRGLPFPAAGGTRRDIGCFQHALVVEQVRVVVHAGRQLVTQGRHQQTLHGIRKW